MKTILSAIFTVALVSVLVGAGTFAYYTDTEVSSGNTYTGGTIDLYMEDHDTDISAEWTMSNMAPGESWTNGELNLWNNGTIEANHVEISFSTECNDPVNEDSDTLIGAVGMDKYLKVTTMSYGRTGDMKQFVDLNGDSMDTNYVDDYNKNGYIDLHDLNGVTFDNLTAPAVNKGNQYDFVMNVIFHQNATNAYQGDECILTVTFTLNQDESQSHTPEP